MKCNATSFLPLLAAAVIILLLNHNGHASNRFGLILSPARHAVEKAMTLMQLESTELWEVFSSGPIRVPGIRFLSVLTAFVGQKHDHYMLTLIADVRAQVLFCENIPCETEILFATTRKNLNRMDGDALRTLLAFMEASNNVILIVFAKDPGLYAMWNAMIQHFASGKYLTTANMDDRRHPNSWATKVRYLEANHGLAVLATPVIATDKVMSWAEAVRTGCISHWPVWYEDLSTRSEIGVFEFFSGDGDAYPLQSYNFPHNSPVWRASLHAKCGYFNMSWDPYADFEFWLRCASVGAKFRVLSEPFELYFVDPDSYGRQGSGGTSEDRLKANAVSLFQKYACPSCLSSQDGSCSVCEHA